MPSEYVPRGRRRAAEADALERAVDAPVGAAVARRGMHVEVLAAGEVPVEARLLDDRADARERPARPPGRSWPSRCMRPAGRAGRGRAAGG